MDDHVNESLDWSKKTHNIEIIELSPGEKAKWDAKLAPITDKWIKDASEKGLPAKEIVADIQAAAQK